MKAAVATVEPNGKSANPLRSTHAGPVPDSAVPGPRFAYASGAQPLAGFTIKRGVGHGGFGEVYYAVSEAGKEVALKLIRRNLDVELRGVRHCLNLKNPNLLSVFDIRTDDQGDSWVVMEYVNGQRLEEAIAAHPHGMPPELALAWFFGMAAGVACLHDHGIVHRDLKPGNIFCDEGVVKLGDYGLSKFISCSRRSGQTESVGTVHYMAPEIANGRYGKEIDIYALGVILYELLTGRVPFEGESVGEVLMKHLTSQPDVSPLAEPYRKVVARALEKDPAKRYRSVGEMLEALPRPAEMPPGMGRTMSQVAGSNAAATPAQKHLVGAVDELRAAAAAIEAAAMPSPGAQAAGPTGSEEPIFRAVRDTWRKGCEAWKRSQITAPVRAIILVAAVWMLFTTSGAWLPMLITLLMIYGCYWVVRALVLAFAPPTRCGPLQAWPAAGNRPQQGSPFAMGSLSPGAAPTGPWVAPRDPRWNRGVQRPQQQPLDAIVIKSPRERLAELFGSMLGSAMVVVIACVVTVIVGSYQRMALDHAHVAWLLATSIVMVWPILVLAKFWEGKPGDAWLRRFTLLVVGLAIGAATFAIANVFVTQLIAPSNAMRIGNLGRFAPGLYAADGQPTLVAAMAAFGVLLPSIGWWRQTNPLRSTRLSLWTTFWCGLVAWAVSAILGYPMPWLIAVSCITSVAVQLSSPWIDPNRRPSVPQ